MKKNTSGHVAHRNITLFDSLRSRINWMLLSRRLFLSNICFEGKFTGEHPKGSR